MLKVRYLFFLIIILAAFLRLFKLSEYPATLYGDEQAFAYNAYSILLTGKDEYGEPYPLQFRSFNDYKAPIPVYLLVPFIKLLGLNAYAIRLPIAFASVVAVFVSFFLFRLFINNKISLIAMLLFAVSPWHVHLSRGYFEATLALSFFVLGILFFIRKNGSLLGLILSMVFFAAAIYSYFTPRILIPLFLLFLFWFDFKFNKIDAGRYIKVKKYFLCLIIFVVLCLPMIYATFFGQGLSRFNKLSESNNQKVMQTVIKERNSNILPMSWRPVLHNKFLARLSLIKNDYIEHLSPNFWYIYGDNSLRYFTGNMGMFYLFELPFLILGLYSLWNEKRKVAVFFLGWLLLAPVPAALVGRSFAVRSLAMLPAPFIFVAYGIYKSITAITAVISKKILILGFVLLFAVSIGRLMVTYYLEYPVYAATWWGWENKAAIDYIRGREKDYDYIFLSDFYTGMPMAYAVYNSIHPTVYQQAVNNPVIFADGRRMIKFGKIYIGSLDIDKNRLNQEIIPKRSMYLGRPEEADSGNNITAPDDRRVIFRVYTTD